MTVAYFQYNPVGESTYAQQELGKDAQSITLHMSDVKKLIASIAESLAAAGIDTLYCNKAGMGLAPAIKQYVLSEYNNSDLIIKEYQGE